MLPDATAGRRQSSCGRRAQLHEAEFAAHPGRRQRKHDEREWIPVGPEGRSPVPRHRGADNAHGEAYNAAHQGVLHGPIGREPCNEVAAHDAIDGAIGRGKPARTGTFPRRDYPAVTESGEAIPLRARRTGSSLDRGGTSP